jgi:hypothetical protein
MPSYRELISINDPAFGIGEKVQPKKAEPAPCAVESFERGDKCPAHFGVDLGDPRGDFTVCQEIRTVKESLPVADPDGWIPHDGGPCPVAAGTAGMVKFQSGNTSSKGDISRLRWPRVDRPSNIVAYKLATPAQPEAPEYRPEMFGGVQAEQISKDPVLGAQQLRQCAGLPVEWDKVPVGSKVWVRGGGKPWKEELFEVKRSDDRVPFVVKSFDGLVHSWTQCKLHIEGVEP